MALVGIGSGLVTLYQRFPESAPIILFVSLIGLWWRLMQLRREVGPHSESPESLGVRQLRSVDVIRYSSWIKGNLRGHDEAVDRILRRLQQGLSLAGRKRTLGDFMLVGPTGTGKTFLAELVSEALYPEAEPVLLRMNQFKHSDDVYTLLGPPPGQPGYEVGGALTRPVLENPKRVVILDEIDKCHRDIQHCLYNILDTAYCREKSSGRSVLFNACAVFATCNGGAAEVRRVMRETSDEAGRIGRLRDALAREAGFEKAFLARFDEIIFMDELAPIHIAEVACLQIAKYWREFGIEVTYADPELIVEAMRKNAEFREYGVRQLAHFIQTLTDASIERARQGGARHVRLDIDRSSGELAVRLQESS